MLSRRILSVIGVVLVAFAWMVFWKENNSYMIPLGICLVLGIIVYTFQYQLDFWWMKKKEPTLDPEMQNMVAQTNPFFQSLDPEGQEKFEKRMVLWVQAKDFIMQGAEENLPEDLKYAAASYAIMLTFYRDEFLMTGLDRVAFYPHVFLTPKYNDDVHACEVELEDGTFIFAVQQAMHGHLKPKQYYNIFIHTFAEALKLKDGESIEIEQPEAIWKTLHQISNISKDKIEAFIGLPLNDPWPMIVHHYFVYPIHMKEKAPDLFDEVKKWHEGDRFLV